MQEKYIMLSTRDPFWVTWSRKSFIVDLIHRPHGSYISCNNCEVLSTG